MGWIFSFFQGKFPFWFFFVRATVLQMLARGSPLPFSSGIVSY